MAAGAAQAQMHPPVPSLEALLAALRRGCHDLDCLEMGALVGHSLASLGRGYSRRNILRRHSEARTHKRVDARLRRAMGERTRNPGLRDRTFIAAPGFRARGLKGRAPE